MAHDKQFFEYEKFQQVYGAVPKAGVIHLLDFFIFIPFQLFFFFCFLQEIQWEEEHKEEKKRGRKNLTFMWLQKLSGEEWAIGGPE